MIWSNMNHVLDPNRRSVEPVKWANWLGEWVSMCVITVLLTQSFKGRANSTLTCSSSTWEGSRTVMCWRRQTTSVKEQKSSQNKAFCLPSMMFISIVTCSYFCVFQCALPELDNPLSKRIRSIISSLLEKRPNSMKVKKIKGRSKWVNKHLMISASL